ncbi:MAG: hypothetical protein MUF30_01215 [Burkholderiales bacterium]|nr:hypothetical protein [Burkholderiales bacterium]
MSLPQPPSWYGTLAEYARPAALPGYCAPSVVDYCFRGVCLRSVTVQADHASLTQAVQDCLGGDHVLAHSADDEGRALVHVDLIRYADMRHGSCDALPPSDPRLIGQQNELVFRCSVRPALAGTNVQPPRAVFVPFIFVDFQPSALVGRRAAGYPKLMAAFLPRGWTCSDPAGPVEIVANGADANRSRIRFPIGRPSAWSAPQPLPRQHFTQRCHPILSASMQVVNDCPPNPHGDSIRRFQRGPLADLARADVELQDHPPLELLGPDGATIFDALGLVGDENRDADMFTVPVTGASAARFGRSRWQELL